MRACFMGQTISVLGHGIAYIQTPPMQMDRPEENPLPPPWASIDRKEGPPVPPIKDGKDL